MAALLTSLGISIHAPREGGDPTIYYAYAVVAGISIHAPREGGDFIDEVSLIWDNHFNPRPPRGGRPVKPRTQKKGQRFQSTPPARGATTACQEPVILAVISIHAPREGGDQASALAVFDVLIISIHAPREGGDFTTSILR